MKAFLSFALLLVAVNAITDRIHLRKEDWPYVAGALAFAASMFFTKVLAELCGDWARLRESIRKFLADPLGLSDW